MKIIRNLHPNIVKKYPNIQGCSLTIGNFESVHLGHLKLLNTLNKNQNKKVLISFEPTPNAYFLKAHQKIYGVRQKIELLAKNLDYLVLLRFNQKLANLSAQDFLTIIHQSLNPSHISIGDDFCFGKNRTGNANLIKEFCDLNKINFYQLPTFSNLKQDEKNQTRFSTSLVRKELNNHNFAKVKQILGREYCLTGKVRKGLKLARQIGTPTANIKLNFIPVISGVFATRVSVKSLGITKHNAIANLGIKPTVKADNQYYLEVHLLDQNHKSDDFSLYGETLEVEFIEFIRKEQKFESVEKLKAQIQKDIQVAKSILK